MTKASLTVQQHHLNKNYLVNNSKEREPKILLCGQSKIASDPWRRETHLKFLSHRVFTKVESSGDFSDSFIEALTIARDKNLTVALVYTCSGDTLSFTAQIEIEVRKLFNLAQDHNGLETKLLTIFLTPEKQLSGRLLLGEKSNLSLSMIRVIGNSIRLHYADRGKGFSPEVLQRQALAFGKALNQDLSRLRIGIVGCGGTGSAVAMLLSRLRVGYIALFDPDIVEDTNLNRLHGKDSTPMNTSVKKRKLM